MTLKTGCLIPKNFLSQY